MVDILTRTAEKNTEITATPKQRSAGICFFTFIAGMVAILDQATKLVVLRKIELYETIPVISGFFNLTRLHNPGGAFGFMASGSSTTRSLLFLGASLLALVLIVYFYKNTPKSHRFLSGALSMIFGGAVGNIIDRIRFGEVIDFLDFYIGAYHWPAFNVADSAITVGISIFIFHVVFNKMPDI